MIIREYICVRRSKLHSVVHHFSMTRKLLWMTLKSYVRTHFWQLISALLWSLIKSGREWLLSNYYIRLYFWPLFAERGLATYRFVDFFNQIPWFFKGFFSKLHDFSYRQWNFEIYCQIHVKNPVEANQFFLHFAQY